jgi:glycosyltransferase involved in cell wall biosynthesis
MDMTEIRSALVHHWLLGMTGGERVCEAICETLGRPDIYCLVADVEALSPILRDSSITTSFIQRLPGARKHYRLYATLFPVVVELFDVSAYDVVISSDANMAKGVITQPETCHICYCHGPMRYAWNMYHQYLARLGPVARSLAALWTHYVRLWDYSAAARVDYFVANSRAVRSRILKYYRREAHVIHPPCDVERFRIAERPDDYYLCVGRLVGYKRIDLAVEAFNRNGKRLVIAGTGPEYRKLKSRAQCNIEFLGRVSDDELANLYSKCKALVFPGEEDFGIVPVEAQASGRPVIAYGKGGVLDTVVPGHTGVFFDEQNPDSLNTAILGFDRVSERFDSAAIRKHACRFSKDIFTTKFLEFVQNCWESHRRTFSQRV